MPRKPDRVDRAFTRKAIRDSIPLRSGRTAYEIAATSGYSKATVNRVLAEMREASEARVIGWEFEISEDGERRGQSKAMYARGKGPNVPRPSKLEGADKSRNYRARCDRKSAHKILFEGDK